MDQQQEIHLFKERAGLVSARVHDVMPLEQALATAVEICKEKAPCQLRSPEMETTDAGVPMEKNGPAYKRTIAAPDLEPEQLRLLASLCGKAELHLVQDDLRAHARGMDMGITHADFGIVDTGTLVISCDEEAKRLASMVSDIHVALLPRSRLRPTALDLAPELEQMMDTPHSYTAFITGPSRTADIERVLAIGVHGPLELHIMLLED